MTISNWINSKIYISVPAMVFLLLLGGQVSAQQVRFLIPAGEGGGWDTTARAVGKTLNTTGLAEVSEYTNYSGAGGGRALIGLINDQVYSDGTLMVQSTPLIVRALTGVYKNTWRDITPVATLISAYQAIAVPADSKYQSINDLIADMKVDPSKVPVAGGSSSLSLDHLTLGLVAQAGGLKLAGLRYSPADGGKEALDRMLDGNVKAVVSGVGELLPALSEGKIRLLGVSSPDPIEGLDAPTFRSQGLDVVFANWRGFFAAPGVSQDEIDRYTKLLVDLSETPEWAAVLAEYKWEPLVLTGDELKQFLTGQEKDLEAVLAALQN